MNVSLPYLATPSSIITALQKIRDAATPERVTADFVTTKLNIKGGTGNAIPPFLKKLNLVASDGKPTDLYQNFRNKTTGGKSIAEAIKIGYRPLLDINEYFYELDEKSLKALIVQVTGLDVENKIVKLTFQTLQNLKQFASFDGETILEATDLQETHEEKPKKSEVRNKQVTNTSGLNLSYTINLNLPATSDQAVFNAIFKSLKEHLLSDE